MTQKQQKQRLLRKLRREVKKGGNSLTKDELEQLRCCCKNNKYLILLSTVCSCAGLLWLNRKIDNQHADD
tara:strand:+ start:1144 stop:1353 length:210 start_codon:yes stop_codon:yes gene_type:complete